MMQSIVSPIDRHANQSLPFDLPRDAKKPRGGIAPWGTPPGKLLLGDKLGRPRKKGWAGHTHG